MIRTRLATVEDAELIAEFSRRTFYDTFARDNTEANMNKFMDEQFSFPALAEEAKQLHHLFFLVFEDDQLAGYAFMRSAKLPPELAGLDAIEIARIYVDQSFIGKGIGKILMEHCIRFAGENNKQVVWLGVWEHNAHAIEFYKKWGFEKFSSHEFLLGDDVQTDWLMRLLLK